MKVPETNDRVTVLCDADENADGIWPVLRWAPATLETIAPERFDELLASVLGVTIHLKDDDACRAYASSDSRTITFCRGLAECLWCASYAYYAFRVELEAQIRSHGGKPARLEITSNDSPEIAAAMRALRASMVAACNGQPLSWDGLPRPVDPKPVPKDGSLVAKAGEMVLGAFGFIMHHELAHVRLGHAGGPDTQWTLDQEKDADSEAICWILDKAPMAPIAAVAKRTWGIGIATAFMTAVRLGRRAQGASPAPVEDQTHPQPYDRMDKAIQHPAIQGNDTLKATMTSLACAALVPHIRIAGVGLADGPYDDWDQLYDKCLDVLSAALVQ